MAPPPEDSSFSAASGDDPREREEAYGPIRLRRYVKDDGRALVLYSQGAPRGVFDAPPAVEDPQA